MDKINNVENNEQLAYMEQNDTRIAIGDVINGEIISLNDKEAYLNIGYKVDGILPKEEVTKDENIQLTNLFKLGDVIAVKVISRRNADGYVVLSKIELERNKAFDRLKSVYENKDTIQVIVKEAVNGGLVAHYNSARVFIPASHIELSHVDDLDSYIGKTLEVNIIEFKTDRRSTKIIASRRELLKAKRIAQESETWSKLEKDQTVTGEVKRLTDFGAFVDIDGVDGLLHVSEISWGRILRPGDLLKTGDKVQVKIIEIDKENKKLSLSMKQLVEDPWNNAEEKYPIGNVVLGKVVRFASFGAFIELEPGIDALVHISQISNKRIAKPGEILKIGDMVKAKILEVNKENKRIALSIKEVNEE